MYTKIMLLMLLLSFYACIENTVATAYYKSSFEYSLKELNNRGLPAVKAVTPPGTTDYFAFIDIPSREVMNLTFPHCFFKEDMEDWCCGENRSACPLKPRANSRITPYAYCIVSEVWPQENLSAWLDNTVFGAPNVSWIGYRMYCACQLPGRAVWVSANPKPQPEFQSCHKDNVLWALFIILTVMWFALLVYCCYLFYLKMMIVYRSKDTLKCDVSSFIKVFTSFTVLWFIIAACLRITSLVWVMIKKLSDPKNSNTNGWLEFFSGFCILLGSTWTVFVFSTMAERIKSIRENSVKYWILSSIKWIFAFISASVLCTLIGLHAFALSNVQGAVNAYKFTDAAFYGERAIYFVRIEIYVAIFLLFVIMVSFASFILFIFLQVGFVPEEKGSYKTLFIQRVYYLSAVTVVVFFFIALQMAYIFTISFDTGAYWTNDEFLSSTAGLWFQWFGAFFHFIWVLFTILAISIVKDKKGGQSYESDFSSGEQPSSSSSKSKSTMNPSVTESEL